MFGYIRRCLTLICLVSVTAAYGNPPEARCETVIARLTTAQGSVEWRSPKHTEWQRAEVKTAFCPGDQIRVEQSASLQLHNNTVLRLSAGALIKFEKETSNFWVKLIKGAAYFLTKTPQSFKIEAPYVNAAIEGTEFVIEHKEAEDRITVFEGQVSGSNSYGKATITDNEQLIAKPGQAPTRVIHIDMLDQAQWVLYAPLLIDINTLTEEVKQLLYLGNYYEAFQQQIRKNDKSSNTAALALYFGDTELAKSIIQGLPDNQAPRYALEAFSALRSGNTSQAEKLIKVALQHTPNNTLTQSVHSYILQASAQLEAALDAAKGAAALAPGNPFSALRTAELCLNLSDHACTQKAIEQSLTIAELPRAYLFNGVLSLQIGQTKKAQNTFIEALELDPSDPLAHFVLGITYIQQNKGQRGRSAMEMAVALNPGNSLFRSYLAKAYATENRIKDAEIQLNLAEQLDPNDPTPWLYRALIEQNRQRYIPALRALEESLEKNDGRAIQRSRLQLDSDTAVKQANLANTYLRLGLDTQAERIASKSIQRNPTDYSSHKMLADTLNLNPRQNAAASSEFLQAQMRQPLQARLLDPLLAERNLLLNQSFAPYQLGLTEYSSLFNTQGLHGHVALSGGNRDTQNQSMFVNGHTEKFAGAVSYYNYSTEGDKSDFKRDYRLGSVYLQTQITSQLSILLEGRQRETDQLVLNNISTNSADDFFEKTDTLRLGLRYNTLSKREWLLVADKKRDDSGVRSINNIPGIAPGQPDTSITVESQTQDDVVIGELQTTASHGKWHNIVGARMGKIERTQKRTDQVTLLPGPLPPIELPPTIENTDQTIDIERAYAYLQGEPLEKLNIDAGISLVRFKGENLSANRENEWQVKLGTAWQAHPRLNLRAAYFEQFQPPLELNQSLEPTRIGGFNQLFDDTAYIGSENIGLGVDVHLSKKLSWLSQALHRTLSFADSLNAGATTLDQEIEEKRMQTEWIWSANDRLSYRISMEAEEQSFSNVGQPRNLPNLIRTQVLNQRLFYALSAPVTLAFELDWVRQKTDTQLTEALNVASKEIFWVSNIDLRYRFARNRWELSLQGRNLANENFDFQDASIADGQKRSLRYLPERSVALTISAQF